MEAEIIAVGTELLLGDILNTNAQFLSRELAALGISVHYQTVVGDNAERLENVVHRARQRSDLLIFSGGLGPTEDDLTKQTVAKAYGDELRFDEEELKKIQGFFRAWGRTMPENNRRQAYVPVNGRKIENHNGTAPGMIFEDTREKGKYAVLLPGPPKELQPMFLQTVRPWLASMSDSVLYSLTLRVMGIGESHLQEKIGHLLENQNPTAALYAKTSEVVIRITAKAKDLQSAKDLCSEYADRFYKILGDFIYTQTEDSLEETVVHILKEKGKSVATAESCTGGLLSARITAVPGSSEVFEYGACTYANHVKEQVLHVKHETLEQYGAVSPQVAAEMAEGVRRVSGADFGVGITGIAGPGGGTPEKPVGLVYVAAACADTTYVQKLVITGRTREIVRLSSTQRALDMIRRLALQLEQPGCRMFPAGTPADFPQDVQIKDV
ncbi:competence/damage-inducible protein A [uncultured Ruthenibacterium sp.]|uniref:competence/damage-inducible protein A n=1 Tax=uncultured Ruthenibacterium sp. TaxID=1905347 RepID=UPI00349E918C